MYPIWAGNKVILFTVHKRSYLDLLQLILVEQLWQPQGFSLKTFEKSFLFEKYDYPEILRTVLCSKKLADVNMLKLQSLCENTVLLTKLCKCLSMKQ